MEGNTKYIKLKPGVLPPGADRRYLKWFRRHIPGKKTAQRSFLPPLLEILFSS